jgi:flagellar assembly protein FliH
MLDGLYQARHDVLDEAEDTLVEIAFAAVCQLAGTDAVARAVVAHAVREAAARLHADESLTVLLHPDDLACLDEAERQWGNVEFTASPAVAVGGCMIDGGKGTLDARLEVQLARLCGALARAREAQRNGGGA